MDQYFICRDPRGFAVKFYTEEGIWDLVGNNTPIFFIKDPLLFPSFIHTQKRNPTTHLKVRTEKNLLRSDCTTRCILSIISRVLET